MRLIVLSILAIAATCEITNTILGEGDLKVPTHHIPKIRVGLSNYTKMTDFTVTGFKSKEERFFEKSADEAAYWEGCPLEYARNNKKAII